MSEDRFLSQDLAYCKDHAVNHTETSSQIQTDIHTDRRTDRQTYEKTDIQSDRHTRRLTDTNRHAERQRKTETDRETNRETDRKTVGQTDRMQSVCNKKNSKRCDKSHICSDHPRCATPIKVVMWGGVPDVVNHAKFHQAKNILTIDSCLAWGRTYKFSR